MGNKGYNVALTQNVEETVDEYGEAMEKNHPFDAVILDLTIAGGTGGVEAIKKLKEVDPDFRGIISTGYSNDPILTTFRSYGFKSAIVKPYTLERLKAAIAFQIFNFHF